jgi:ABC-type nitrate/sulfonate/bicarbonate transport system substrate-binding protein
MNSNAVATQHLEMSHTPTARLCAWLLVLFVLFPITPTAAAATRDLERVRIGYSVGGLIPFPLTVAKENRFFEQAGFDAELINIPPTIAVTALVSGDIQYVVFAGTTLNAAVRGLPVKLVMVLTIDRCFP